LVGALSIAAGIILVIEPSNSLATLAVVVGILFVFDGIIELARSIGGAVEHRTLSAILGLLGIVIGIILIRHPFHAVSAIGLLIGLWLVAAGALRLVFAIMDPAHPWPRFVIAGIELIVGIIIVSDPHIGYSALAIIVGIGLILGGIAQVLLGFALRRLAKAAARAA
jgi:uncharacterized membrane protein HdeD (DUF308 family)